MNLCVHQEEHYWAWLKTLARPSNESGRLVDWLIVDSGLRLVSNASDMEQIIDDVLLLYADQVEEYRSGNKKLFGWFLGKAMKATHGKADPQNLAGTLKIKLETVV